MKAIFIVGTGRSGTHFTTNALSGFSNFYDPLNCREYDNVLYPIAKAAIGHQNYPSFAKGYYEAIKLSIPSGKVFVDQHHPNLFFVNDLVNIFDDVTFLCPRRDILQIVSSMLQHSGVMSWYNYFHANYSRNPNLAPFPNKFLGVASFEQLNSLEPHQLCAYRVVAHYKEMRSLTLKYDSCRFFNYSDLVADQYGTFASIFNKDELDSLGKFNPSIKSDPLTLYKYQNHLTNNQIDDILYIERSFC